MFHAGYLETPQKVYAEIWALVFLEHLDCILGFEKYWMIKLTASQAKIGQEK